MNIAIAAGGTAGHVFPAFALYDALRADGARVVLLTDDRGQRYAGEFDPADVVILPSGGIVTGSITKRVGNIAKLGSGLVKSWRYLRSERPDAVVGMGGYAAVGPIVAARALGIRTVLHEQNSVMGLANKVAARSADVIALTFDPTEGARGNCVVTGNPCRRDVSAVGAAPYPAPSDDEAVGVLVMGGSQGARSVSQTVPTALAALDPALRNRLRVVHQARDEDAAGVRATYGDAGIEAEVLPFIDVPEALGEAHLFIGRSGASTVCDVAVAGRPAVYLPLLTHADLQQVKNAQAVIDVGGALALREDESSTADLTEVIADLLSSPHRLAAMAAASRSWSRPDAIDRIVSLITPTTG